MSFELDKHESPSVALRRVATECLDDAIRSLRRSRTHVTDTAAHTARKRLKQFRALLRLARDGALPDKTFRDENTVARDAARPLSDLRDAAVMIETLAELLSHFSPDVSPKPFSPLQRALQHRHAEAQRTHARRALRPTITALTQARGRIPRWALRSEPGFCAFSRGLKRAYRDGRRAMHAALEPDRHDVESLHEWRKRAKDLRHQLEFLSPINAEILCPLADQAKDLTDALGKDHDLAVLADLLDEELRETLPGTERHTLRALLDERRRELQKKAAELGRLLYAEKPNLFLPRIESYWDTSRD